MIRILILKMTFCLSLLPSANAWSTAAATDTSEIKHYSYEILAERSHKKQVFTQGLLLQDNHFYESSGRYGSSFLAVYPVAEPENKWAQLSAKFTRQARLPPRYFAEGLTLFNDRLYLLTWQEQTLLIYNRTTLALEQSLNYSGEGWGLTHDNTYLIRSDGSHRLTFHEPQSFKPHKVVEVFEGGRPLQRLNELEYIRGKIWANIWHENRLVEIDPESGKVIGSLDLSQLAATLSLTDSEQVLNGIAYDEEQQALWVTGKLWPKMFLIKLNSPH